MRDGHDTAAYLRWAETRSRMEARREKHNPDGRHRRRHWPVFKFLIQAFGRFLKVTGLYRRGVRNAQDLGLRRIELAFDTLPAAFDGYTLLHLTDPHFGGLEGITERAIELIDGLEVDLCVMTGDYRFRTQGPIDAVLPGLQRLVGAVKARDGIIATLGNHDTVRMVAPMADMGLMVLANQTHTLTRDGASVHLTGIDDVHYYYTDQARTALYEGGEGFRIALVHSPELADVAAAAGVAFYLTGHTHGGQVCLPGGRPVITHSGRWRRYAAGLWRHGAMVGYTSCGIGISGLPVRFNTRGEVTLITLRRTGAEDPAPD